MQKYILMNKDTPVASISVAYDETKREYGLHVDNVLNATRLPYGAKKATAETLDKQITDWHESRCIPYSRPNYPELMQRMDITSNNQLLAKSYMCSLTDAYWFKPEGSEKTWADVNFRDNGFKSELYKQLFFNPDGSMIVDFNSPDLTTNGVLPKMWIQREDNFYLIKDSAGRTATESCNEILASKMIAQMGIDSVEYGGAKYQDKIMCRSACFIQSNDESFVPVENLLKDMHLKSHADMYEHLQKWGFNKEVEQMMLCDYLLGNTDRHPGNYGFVINSDSQRINNFAPLFDHGASDFFNDVSFMTYPLTGDKLGNMCKYISPETLKLVDNIDLQKLEAVIDKMGFSPEDKVHMLGVLDDRIMDVRRELSRQLDRERGE